MKIAVIGGGITGLTAAYLLAKKNHQLAVFEKEPKLGGLVSSFKESGWSWSLERFYHHFFSSDKEVLGLLEKLEIKNKLFFKNPQTSVFVDNQIFELLQNFLPPSKKIEWDIEVIGTVRDAIQEQIVYKQKIMSEGQFYPYIKI